MIPLNHIGPVCSSALPSLTVCFDKMRQNGRSQVWLRIFTFALALCGEYFLPFSLRELSRMASAEHCHVCVKQVPRTPKVTLWLPCGTRVILKCAPRTSLLLRHLASHSCLTRVLHDFKTSATSASVNFDAWLLLWTA